MSGAARIIGFIGLGAMGAPMARNLIKAGHTLRVFDARSEALTEFSSATGAAALKVRRCAPMERTW